MWIMKFAVREDLWGEIFLDSMAWIFTDDKRRVAFEFAMSLL